MAVPAAAGQRYLVTFRMGYASQIYLNTFVYNLTNAGSLTSVSVACDTLKAKLDEPNALYDRWKACLPNNVTIDEVRVQCIYPTRVAAAIYPTIDVGTFIDSADTGNQAATITRKGELANRKNIGSLHMVAPSGTGSILGGTIQAAYRSALDLLAAEIKTAYSEAVFSSVWTPVLYSRTSPSLLTPIVDTAVQDTARVMRRRTLRVGI